MGEHGIAELVELVVEKGGLWEFLALGHGSGDSARAAVAVVAEARAAPKLRLHVSPVRACVVERR